MLNMRNDGVDWTTDLWACTGCGVEVGQPHKAGCAMLYSSASVVWLGPPVTPGMLPRTIVEGDVAAHLLACQHCEESFVEGDVIFENRAQSVGIHASCVLLLAEMIPRSLPSPAEIEEAFENRRAGITDRR